MVTIAYPRKGLPWTEVGDGHLRQWYETKGTAEIADLLGRTSHSVYERMRLLGLPNARRRSSPKSSGGAKRFQ